ncbi:DUF1858 domain-containing protein [Yoonia sp. 208BN28-4]|uniref:DUF1858 domain-containing protein n=1 Tax=Yoonia sp. 208BN28-4 TaxID=3126505 RepID=UPI0030986188
MTPAKLTDPDLLLVDMMVIWPETITVFVRHRMQCVGCLVGGFHTLDDACAAYGLNRSDLLADLRKAVTDDQH